MTRAKKIAAAVLGISILGGIAGVFNEDPAPPPAPEATATAPATEAAATDEEQAAKEAELREKYPAADPAVVAQIEAAGRFDNQITVRDTFVMDAPDTPYLQFVAAVFDTQHDTDFVGVWTVVQGNVNGAANPAAYHQTRFEDVSEEYILDSQPVYDAAEEFAE